MLEAVEAVLLPLIAKKKREDTRVEGESVVVDPVDSPAPEPPVEPAKESALQVSTDSLESKDGRLS